MSGVSFICPAAYIVLLHIILEMQTKENELHKTYYLFQTIRAFAIVY